MNDQKTVKELLHLGFQQYQPSESLNQWIDLYWSAQAELSEPVSETLYPDGGCSLIFNFESDGQRGVWFNTTQSVAQETFQGTVERFGVRFSPGGIYALLGLELYNLIRAEDYPVTALAIPPCDALFNAMINVDIASRITLFEHWLQHNSAKQILQGPVQDLWPLLRRPETDIADDLRDTGISRRRFEKLFRQQTGMTPNKFKMMWRIKRARYLIKTEPQLSFTEIALQCHYFDQAHFNRHFKLVVGVTPGQYRQRQLNRITRKEMSVQPLD